MRRRGLSRRMTTKPRAARGVACALLFSSVAAAQTPTVLARRFGNVEADAVWWQLHEVGPEVGDVWLLGRTNENDPSGSLVWDTREIILRAADLAIDGHPLDPSVAVGAEELRRGWGAELSGRVVMQAALRCDDCPLDGEEAVLRVHRDGSAAYVFSAFDEMLLGGELVRPSGVDDVQATRAGRIYAVLRIVGGLSTQYGFVRTTGEAPPQHVEGLLLHGDAIHAGDGAPAGEFDDLFVPTSGRAFHLLPWSGETVLLGWVNDAFGRSRHILRNGVSVMRPGDTLHGLPIADLVAVTLGEGGELWYAGLLAQGGDVTGSDDAFIAWSGRIAVREGDPCPGLTGYTFGGFGPELAADHHGNVAFIWQARDGSGTVHDVLYYNGVPLLQAGDLLDVTGDGIIDADDHEARLVSLSNRGDLILRRDSLLLLGEAVLPQYGLREVLVRLSPLPDLDNPWDERPPCPGDVDGDRSVGQADLGLLLAAYDTTESSPAYDPRADFDADGDVDQADLGVVTAVYETACDG